MWLYRNNDGCFNLTLNTGLAYESGIGIHGKALNAVENSTNVLFGVLLAVSMGDEGGRRIPI